MCGVNLAGVNIDGVNLDLVNLDGVHFDGANRVKADPTVASRVAAIEAKAKVAVGQASKEMMNILAEIRAFQAEHDGKMCHLGWRIVLPRIAPR